MKNKIIKVETPTSDPLLIGHLQELVLIAGPCAIESYDHSMRMADLINSVCRKLSISWIFKACYDKDCRSSPKSFR